MVIGGVLRAGSGDGGRVMGWDVVPCFVAWMAAPVATLAPEGIEPFGCCSEPIVCVVSRWGGGRGGLCVTIMLYK